MARLERWKYIPMLVRAYQEAKTRAQSHSEELIQRSSSDVPRSRGAFAPSENVTTREAGLGSSTRRIAKRSSSVSETAAVSGLNRMRRTLVRPRKAVQKPVSKKTANPTLNQAKKRANLRTAPRKLQPKARVVQQSRAQHSRASIQDVLQELRSTKQQLSQLRAIQMQLSDVQSQLSQQLQVLKGSIHEAEESQVEKQQANREQQATDNTNSDVQTTPPHL